MSNLRILSGLAAAAVAFAVCAHPARALTRPEDAGKVAPGLVSWHDGYRSALAAAGNTGKPVFLFLLLGNLDDQFC